MTGHEHTCELAVAIPAQGSAHLLERCLASIGRASDLLHLEVSIALDGPDDELEALLSRWTRLKGVSLNYTVGEARGIGAARNEAVKQARAPYITLLDMDDELDEGRLRWFRANRSILDSRCIYIGDQNVVGMARFDPGKWKGVSDRHQAVHLGTMLLSRCVWETLGGFDETVALSDDWDFILRARSTGLTVEFINEIFVQRHIGEHNASLDHASLHREYVEGIRRHINRRRSP